MTLSELGTIYTAATTVVVVAAHGLMPYLTVPKTSGSIYAAFYNVARIVAGNYSNAAPALPAAVAALEADVKAATAAPAAAPTLTVVPPVTTK